MKKRHYKIPSGSPDAQALVEKLRLDPEFLLPGLRLGLEEDGNPAYAWGAIDLCFKSNTAFPDWLYAYLVQCAQRMQSQRAKTAREVRDVLPWILGFDGLRERGNALDINRYSYKKAFALAFAIRLDKGDTPPEARLKACNQIFLAKDTNIDDRTLQRWLLEVFGLKKAPADWMKFTYDYYLPYHLAIQDLIERDKTSRDTDVTVHSK
jgi:hypothetical protein